MLSTLMVWATLARADLPATRAIQSEPPPRALAWCVALLEAPSVLRVSGQRLERVLIERAARLRDLEDYAEHRATALDRLTRAVHRWFKGGPVRLNLPRTSDVTLKPALERVVSEAHVRLDATRRDLMSLPEHLFVVRDVVEGEVAIRAYLADVKSRATLTERHLRARLPAPDQVPPRPVHLAKLLTTAAWTGVYGGIAYGTAALSYHYAMHHNVVAVALPFAYYYAFGPSLVARVNRMYLSVRGALTRARPERPEDFAGEQMAAADAILAALNETDRPERFIYSATTIALPLRQWDSYDGTAAIAARRQPPRAGEIMDLVATHGWFAPVDARRFEADLIFYRAQRGEVPTLISVVREAPYAQDH